MSEQPPAATSRLGEAVQRMATPAYRNQPTPRVLMLAGIRRMPVAAVVSLLVGFTQLVFLPWAVVVGALVGGVGAVVALMVAASHGIAPPGSAGGVSLALEGGGLVGAIVSAVVTVLQTFLNWRPLIIGGQLGLVVAVATTAFIALFEPWLLALRGVRRMSRREAARLEPIAERLRADMRLTALPPIRVDDSLEPNAYAHIRHVVVTRGALMQWDDEQLTGVLAHELEHWLTGDAAALRFVWACALPVSLAYNFVVMLEGVPIVYALALLFLWPVVVMERYVIVPAIGYDGRRQEYAADAATLAAGHAHGLYRALEQIQLFEGGRTGWESAVAASHPPIELRLEALEGTP